MEVKVDKRTKEYKASVNPENMKEMTGDGLKPDVNILTDVAIIDELDVFDNRPPKPTKKEFLDTMEAIEQSDPPVINPEYAKRIDNVIIEAAAKPPKPDLLHCLRCGVELLDDERNSKSFACCRKCIWRNA